MMCNDDATMTPRTAVVAITGASGVSIGVRLLELLRDDPSVRSHVIITNAGAMTLREECDLSRKQVEDLADVAHGPAHIGASIASGSTGVAAMLIAPCTIRTLGAIAYGLTNDLTSRAADVCLKEGRPVLLMVRESPLHRGHLDAMSAAATAGAIIAPPVPAFYMRPASVADIVDTIARRALARVGLVQYTGASWRGVPPDAFEPRVIGTVSEVSLPDAKSR